MALVKTVLAVDSKKNAQASFWRCACVTADNKTSNEGFYTASGEANEAASFDPVLPWVKGLSERQQWDRLGG